MRHGVHTSDETTPFLDGRSKDQPVRTMTIAAYGGPEVPTEYESPHPTPGFGQIAIGTTHAAVGLIDVFPRRGDMRDTPGPPQPPFVPGGEVPGTVRAIGAGVQGFRVGEPVVTLPQVTLGGYASVTLARV